MSELKQPPPRSLGQRLRAWFTAGRGADNPSPGPPSPTTSSDRPSIPHWNIPDYQTPADRRPSEAVPPNSNTGLSHSNPFPANDTSSVYGEGKTDGLEGVNTEDPPVLPQLSFRKKKTETTFSDPFDDPSRPALWEPGNRFNGFLKRFVHVEENNNWDRELEQAKKKKDLPLPLDPGKLAVIESDPDAGYGYEEVVWLANQRSVTGSVYADIAYHLRRKDRTKFRIEYNVSALLYRQRFLLRLARALISFGAPSHRIESQLMSAATILEVNAEFVHIPRIIICNFDDRESHYMEVESRLDLGKLHVLHEIYRRVVHDEISAKDAIPELDALLKAPPIYGRYTLLFLSFWISALICPLAFGGSVIDMFIAGAGATVLNLMRTNLKSKLASNIFEVSVTVAISFMARGLGSIGDQLFCYTAISAASIVGILPGFLILSSSLELASKNVLCGSVKMVYAMIYTLFLGFGLQIGSNFFLAFDPSARRDLGEMSKRVVDTVVFHGVFVSDNSTGYMDRLNEGNPLEGIWTFINPNPFKGEHIKNGCYRPHGLPWYRSPFPWWSQFFLVPIFSVLSSSANLQPLFTREMGVQVLISSAAYAANKAANRWIFSNGRADIVSFIGAFVVGTLGNLYSRRMKGTAFTSMVTGVLFLVPSGLSQYGSVTGDGSGIDIGDAMIAVTIGITVGLFLSQAVVYLVGKRKKAAHFSF